jgi:hypothetical protein
MPDEGGHQRRADQARPAFRQVLLDDLAILKLHLEDDLINDGQAGEALARVVGALDLTAEEETWLEQQ